MSHLNFDERVTLSELRKDGWTLEAIGVELGRHKGTISRELQRNREGSKRYRPLHANRQAVQRRSRPTTQAKLEDPELLDRVSAKLLLNWTPQQISGAFKRADGKSLISHQTIYAYLGCLPRDHAHRRAMRRKGRRNRRAKPGFLRRAARDHVSIHDRPGVVDRRNRIGDWELDLMVCSQHSGYLITAVERKSGYSLIRKVASRHCHRVVGGILKMFADIPRKKIKTFTFDNGSEFFYTEQLTTKLGAKVYYADPYNSGQRGTNENTNGLARQYFPKHLHYDSISYWDVRRATNLLNERPRLRHGFKTPAEVFGITPKVALRI